MTIYAGIVVSSRGISLLEFPRKPNGKFVKEFMRSDETALHLYRLKCDAYPLIYEEVLE